MKLKTCALDLQLLLGEDVDMPLFEVKLKLAPEQKDLLVTQLSLEYLRTYTDTDTFVETPAGEPKEKIKEIDGTVKRYTIAFDGKMFLISGDIMSRAEADAWLVGRKKSAMVKRSKDEYSWGELGVTVAFDTIEGIPEAVFFEVYSNNKELVEKARQGLAALGYTHWVDMTYDKLVG